MENKINQYNKLIAQLDTLKQEQNKMDFAIKQLKEKIDEFEANNLHLIDVSNTNSIKKK